MKKIVCYWSGPLLPWAKKSLLSMKECIQDNQIIMFSDGMSAEDQKWFDTLGTAFSSPGMDPNRWSEESMCYRVSLLRELCESSPEGTQIISLDLDTIVQGDLFTAFDADFDVFITSRGYPYHYSINAGCWGFVVSEQTKQFLSYFEEQLKTPSWEDYILYLRKMRALRGNNSTWWLDQDFLCCLNDFGSPLENVKIHDATNKYNYTYDETSAPMSSIVEQYKQKLGDENYIMLHLKGPLKDMFYDN